MDLLVPLQHFDKLLDALRARLGFDGGLNPVPDRGAIDAVQGGEKLPVPPALVEPRLAAGGPRGAALGTVRPLPLAALPRPLDCFQPRRFHASLRDERLRLIPIDLGPDAPGAAG